MDGMAPRKTLWCAKDANLPPASGWIDPDGAPAPAGFTVSVDEDGRAADVFIDRPRKENPEMGGDKGHVERSPAGDTAGSWAQNGSKESEPPATEYPCEGARITPSSTRENARDKERTSVARGAAGGARPLGSQNDAGWGGSNGKGTKSIPVERESRFLDRRPPDVSEEEWKGLPRPRQDALLELWMRSNPDQCHLLDERYQEWLRDQLAQREMLVQGAAAKYSASLRGPGPEATGTGKEEVARPSSSEPLAARRVPLREAERRSGNATSVGADRVTSQTDSQLTESATGASGSGDGEDIEEAEGDAEQVLAVLRQGLLGDGISELYFPYSPKAAVKKASNEPATPRSSAVVVSVNYGTSRPQVQALRALLGKHRDLGKSIISVQE